LSKISENRKSTVEGRPISPKNGRPQRRVQRVNSTKLVRRRFLHLAAGTAALPATTRLAWAQAYPTRPITMIVAAPAGGPSDAVSRILAERMRSSLRQPIIIENVAGADGTIGTGRAARARPDGYTINIGIRGDHVLNGAFYSLTYDVLNDFAPISLLATNQVVLLARKTMPGKDLNELIAWLKANPNKASAGVTSLGGRLMTVAFQKQTGTQFGLVPYRGQAPAIQDLVAGQIDFSLSATDTLALVQAGSIKAYAVASTTRLAQAPHIPTFVEMGLPELVFSGWYGLFAPKGTPKDIIVQLNAAVVEALSDTAAQSRLADLGMDVFPREEQTPEALGALVKAEAEKWWPIIKELGIKAE
jgi:tripartite-type tricarboxylate transporter receptor subunit TctC